MACWLQLRATATEIFRFPAFAWVCRDRRLGAAFLATGAVLGAANSAGIPLVLCPLKAATGLDCPGCGITRGVVACCRGRWAEAMHLHAFSPAVLAAALVVGITLALPGRARARWVAAIESAERRTGASSLILSGILIYGLTRHWVFG
jgi:hypothetical protein